ncbi:phosphate ABC transporter permease PstA [Tessaracoccus oleiagri]|uniref:Phosphate transport system permease protein PstA n=1 Tax=Tessaracoccus oleiagri TaxID=686624 RepID=A0A1G9MV76_9ACTN|nr:phosphate ABC transporter permease PstA [Tessaracoccus oleiagri]SDL78138.1 phosphate transport system permease protein [Tessaracoccus oleiagri]
MRNDTTATAPATPAKRSAPQLPREPITGNQLPKWTWALCLALGLGIAAGILLLLGTYSLAGTFALGVLVFLVLMTVVSAAVEGPRPAKDRLAKYTVTSFFLLALVPLGSLLFEVVTRGAERFDLTFFTETQANTHLMNVELGAMHALVGTLLITALAFLISVPIGLLTAIYLVEYGARTRLAAGIRFLVDVMTGIPSIVAGLFAYALFSMFLGPGTKSGLAGAVALSVLMIPTVVRSTEEMLKLVPNELREASYALGVPKYRTILKVVLPTSLAGIVTGVILGIARIIGETAPLLVTAGYFQLLNTNPFSGPTSTLPVMVYQSLRTHGPRAEEMQALGWAGALTLIILVMGLNLIGRFIAWKFAPKQGR